ncbi:MAG: hypothetical protein ACRD4T_00070 [Candidatus Acidiferrales bacterium]
MIQLPITSARTTTALERLRREMVSYHRHVLGLGDLPARDWARDDAEEVIAALDRALQCVRLDAALRVALRSLEQAGGTWG